MPPSPSTPPPPDPTLPSNPATTTNHASPIRNNSLFASTHFAAVRRPLADDIQEGKRLSMEGKVTAVELDFFMKKYIPAPSRKEPTKKLSTLKWSGPFKPEDDNLAKPMLKAFNSWLKGADNDDNRSSRWDGEGYQVVVTAHKSDREENSKQRVDLALYPTHSAPGHGESPKWSAAEVVIECKPESTKDDPFDDGKDGNEPEAERRKKNLGQIMSYASLIFDHQHRKHQYSIVLFGEMARIVRWDHGGVTVTKKFNYRQEPILLSRFLWRLCHMSAVARGHDPTVEEVHTDSVEYRKVMLHRADDPIIGKECGQELEQHARLLFKESIKDATMCHKIRLHDGEKERSFLVGAPHFLSSELPGRGTRGYVAIDCSNPEGSFVYLKDAWRVDHDGIEPEGKVLKYLNDEKVEGVPTLVCHGDIEDQVTDSQEVWKLHHPGRQDCPVKLHRHYRVVVKEVCLSMSRFRNAKELVHLIATCIRAHRSAYKKGVMHRDVSAGNVLIHIKEEEVNGRLIQTRVGLLTDWELSKRTDATGSPRQPNRTGTWQFMSVYILNHPDMAISIPDELEAFLHVLLHYAIRFLPHNCKDVKQFMHQYFDGYEKGPGEYYCGAAKREAMATGVICLANGQKLLFYSPPDKGADGTPTRADSPSSSSAVHDKAHPINQIFDTLLDLFKARYALIKRLETVIKDPPLARPEDPTDAMDEWWEEEDEDSEEEESGLTSGVTDISAEQLEWKKYETTAAQLQSHSAVLRLFRSFFKVKDAKNAVAWPMHDKVPDQLGKDHHSNRDNAKKDNMWVLSIEPITIPSASQMAQTRVMRTRSLGLPPTASGSSTKRVIREEDDEHDEYDNDAPAPKRNRSQAKKGPAKASKSGKGKSRA